MTTHAAIKDSVVEICRRVGKYNLDVPEMKKLMEFVERSQAGAEFTENVRTKLTPVAQFLSSRNIQEISKVYPEIPLSDIFSKVPANEQDSVWQAIAMTNMLLTTLQMVPAEMLSKIEAMTNTMMGAMQQGGGLNDLFKNMGSVMGGMESDDDDVDESVITAPTKRKKGGASKQQDFRDKLC